MANRGKKLEAVRDFIFLGSKITVGDDCSHEFKRHLLLGRKAIQTQTVYKKTESFTLPTKVHRQIYDFCSSNVQDVRVQP